MAWSEEMFNLRAVPRGIGLEGAKGIDVNALLHVLCSRTHQQDRQLQSSCCSPQQCGQFPTAGKQWSRSRAIPDLLGMRNTSSMTLRNFEVLSAPGISGQCLERSSHSATYFIRGSPKSLSADELTSAISSRNCARVGSAAVKPWCT